MVGWIDSGLLVSEDPAGVMNLHTSTLVVTPDGRGYGYSWHRALSDLYLVEGWAYLDRGPGS